MASRFVGRVEELRFLDAHLQSALAGRGNAVFVSADAGAGKTTLTGEFLDSLGVAYPDVLIIRAGCSEQYGGGEPYQPFVEAFRHLTRDRERSARKGRSFRETARQIAPYWVAAIPIAGEVLAASLHTAAELKQQFHPSGARTAPSEEALFFQYTELFFAVAAETPLVLFLDDLHWADHSTVSLLTHLARRISEQRVLILGTYRPTEVDAGRHPMRDARQELQRFRLAEELVLQPLDNSALADLVLLHSGAVPSRQLFDWLQRRAGTNALFFEELLRWLMSQQLTRENLGELQLVRIPQEIEIPRSAESTIEKRLDKLDDGTRRILEYASVQGDEFDSVSLSRLLEVDELELEEALDPIVRSHRLVQMLETLDLPNGDVASAYRFSHSLIQDVLHASLQGKRRILLHRRMAQIIEEIFGADDASAAPRLALHFEEGRHAEKAYDYAMVAADRASRLYAHWDALDQIHRALRNAIDDGRRSAAAERLGEEFVSISQYTEALAAFDDALRTLAHGADADRLRITRRRIAVEATQGLRPLDALLHAMQQLREEARRLGDRAEECRILWFMIDLPGTTESMDAVLAQEALDIARELGDPALIARGHEVLGLALTFGNAPAAAMAEMEQATELYSALGDRAREAACRSNLSLTRVLIGEYSIAAEEFAAAIRIFDDIVDPMRAAATRSNLGALLRILGRYDEAGAYLLESIRIFERLGVPVRVLSPLMNLAELHEARAEWHEAEKRWTQMLRGAMETGYTAEQIIAHCGIGTARMRLGNMNGAIAAERAARLIVTSNPDSLGESGEALQLFSARLAGAAGEVEGAIMMLEQLEDAVRQRDRYLAAICRLERAGMMRVAGDARALPLIESAANELLSLGAAPDAQRAAEMLRSATAADGALVENR